VAGGGLVPAVAAPPGRTIAVPSTTPANPSYPPDDDRGCDHTWTKSWTAIQEFDLQSSQDNKIYMEPRCHEGNFGLPGILAGARAEEEAYAKGRGSGR